MVGYLFGAPMTRPRTLGIRISITRWVDDSQPGWVEGRLTDAHGRTFSFIEKAPVVSEEDLNARSEYPRQGHIAGSLIERRIDATGREILVIDTSRPWGIEATSGETHFEVCPEQVVGIEAPGVHLMSPVEMEACLKSARTIAVLGIKPETRAHLDAYRIPLYLQNVGYRILPVPTRYPEASRILGISVCRRLVELARPVDVLNVFCKPSDFLPYIEDVLVLRPTVVWFQSGLIEPSAACRLLDVGISVAEDCIGCRRASIWPSVEPFEAQRGAREL
jgi:uncharacterized protein